MIALLLLSTAEMSAAVLVLFGGLWLAENL